MLSRLSKQTNQLPIDDTIWLAAELSKNRVASPQVIDRLLARVKQEPKLLEPLMGQLAEMEDIPAAAIPFLIRLATTPETSKYARAHAMASLSRVNRREAFEAILTASSLSNGGD